MSKTIGILGGMGSWATLKFFEHILSLSEPDEFRIIIDNNVGLPSRSKAIPGNIEESVLLPLNESIWHLSKAGADFVTVPCNQAHCWHGKFKPWIPWLNMVEVVADAVTKKGVSRPLILGGSVTVANKLYSKYLPGAVYLDGQENEPIYQTIRDIKGTGAKPSGNVETIGIAVNKYDHKIDCIIMACTELTVLGLYDFWGNAVIDSSIEYAKATVEYARQ